MYNILLNTFKEIIRNKFLSIILIFALCFIIFSISLWRLTIWDDQKIIIDFWLAMIEIFWLISVLFVWSQLLFKEIDWKTIFLILSKPIKRNQFIIWKFLWFSLSILLVFVIQLFLFFSVLIIKDINIDILIIVSSLFIFLKLEILLAIVFFFSTFLSTILTIIVSILFYFISHNFSIILDLLYRTKNEFYIFWWKFLNIIFPPFEALNMKEVIWSFQDFSWFFMFSNALYWLVYLIIILYFTILIFNNKKFES